VLDGRLLHGDVGTLQVGVDDEDQGALLDPVAFPHGQRLDPTVLVGPDEDELGFHPSLEHGVAAVVAACEGKRRRHREHGEGAPHVEPRFPNSTSRCTRISSSTSSGAKRSNMLFQMIAKRPGATSSCGKRASASSGNSPRATARSNNERTAGTTRA